MFSPRTNSLMQGPAQGTPEDLFRQGFSELALGQIYAQLPDLAQTLVSFAIIDAEPSTDSAVGTAIVDLQGLEVHIPVVMAHNELAPMDMLYVQPVDTFVPLSPEWVRFLAASQAAEMGRSVPTPDTLSSDMDIRNLVIPPSTGRYAYAAAGGKQLLPAYLHEASNAVKTAFVATLAKHEKIAEWIFNHYNVAELRQAVQLRKTASVKTASSAAVNPAFVTIETPLRQIQSVFKEDTPQAMRQISEKGYAAKDMRSLSALTSAVLVDSEITLEDPHMVGFYRVFLKNNEARNALVFPKMLSPGGPFAGHYYGALSNDHIGARHDTPKLVLFEDGSVIVTKKPLMTERLQVNEVPERLKNYLDLPRARTPRNNQRGMFLAFNGNRGEASLPFHIESVVRDGGTLRLYVKDYAYNRYLIVQDRDSSLTRPVYYSNDEGRFSSPDFSVPHHLRSPRQRDRGTRTIGTLYLPAHYVFVPCDDFREATDLATTTSDVLDRYARSLVERGGKVVKVSSDGHNYYLDGEDLGGRVQAVQKLATEHRLHVDAAEYLLSHADHEGQFKTAHVLLLDLATRTKIAQGPPPAPVEMPPEADPAMAADGAPPPPPPPPSPVEIAAQQIAQELMQQQAGIEQQLMTQQQAVQNQLMMLQEIMNRSQQIAYEMGMGPPPPMPSQGPPPAGGAPPQGAPMPPQGPPPAGGAPPQGMPVEQTQAMEQSMALEDPELFDTSAIAALAAANDFDRTVMGFLPEFQGTLNTLGRLLLDLRIKKPEYLEQLGDQLYQENHDRVTDLFAQLGALIVKLHNVSSANEIQQ